jgi:hypothetical protein
MWKKKQTFRYLRMHPNISYTHLSHISNISTNPNKYKVSYFYHIHLKKTLSPVNSIQVQSRTAKARMFASTWGKLFGTKLTSDSDSGHSKTSENDFSQIFPRLFGDRQILSPKNSFIASVHPLRTNFWLLVMSKPPPCCLENWMWWPGLRVTFEKSKKCQIVTLLCHR